MEKYYLIKSYCYYSNNDFFSIFSFINEEEKDLIELIENVKDTYMSSGSKKSNKLYTYEECKEMFDNKKVEPEFSPDEILEPKRSFDKYFITKDNINIASSIDREKIKELLNKRKLLKDISLKNISKQKDTINIIFNAIIFYYRYYYKFSSKDFNLLEKLNDEIFTDIKEEDLKIFNFIFDYIKDKLGGCNIFKDKYNEDLEGKMIIYYAYNNLDLRDKILYWKDIDTDLSFITKQFLEDVKLCLLVDKLLNENFRNTSRNYITFLKSVKFMKFSNFIDNIYSIEHI